MSICDLRLNTGKDGTTEFGNLKSKFLLSPGSPWRARPHIQRRRPRDQRRNFKNSLRVRIKRVSSTLQPSVGAHLLNHQFLLTSPLQAGGKSQHEVKAYRAQVSPS